jgi:hypothetical protein
MQPTEDAIQAIYRARADLDVAVGDAIASRDPDTLIRTLGLLKEQYDGIGDSLIAALRQLIG